LNDLKESNFVITPDEFDCELCRDTPSGMVIVNGEAKRCVCHFERVKKMRFQNAVDITPKIFRDVYGITDGLVSMLPRPQTHPKQPTVLQSLREITASEKPDRSFFFFGRTGAHKTTFAWALMQEAGRRGQTVGGNTGKSLIDTLRNYALHGTNLNTASFYAIEQLERHGEKMCVLIDDIDGIVISEYTFGLLWDLLDKVQAYQQQLIITANRSIDDLLIDWCSRDRDGRANAVNYSEKLARRLKEVCTDVDLT